MEVQIEQPNVGPFRLVRRLEDGRNGQRWLALDVRTQTSHVAHRIVLSHDRIAQRRFVSAMEAAEPLRHAHVLPIEHFSLGATGLGWVVTPFTGNHSELVTLESLLGDKGGRMEPDEAERTLVQILETIEATHAAGHLHGPMTPGEILVDPRGACLIELYGVHRRLRGDGPTPAAEAGRDEIRSVVEIAYGLLTGLSADEPRIAATRLVPRLDGAWDRWIDAGLDPAGGFASATEALAALPGVQREVQTAARVSPVRSVISRFRRALGVK
ncbi:MAG: hypothetical protein JNM80_04115 [Phycisphaerae bacterium]|nr:hypothetical protein [Phycisphaerae bacterium]